MKKQYKVSAVVVLVASFLFGSVGPLTTLAAGPLPVDLLSAESFAVLSKTGITNTGSHTSVITGNIGSSPITAASMNGVFCSEITGTIYGVDAAYVGSGDVTCFAGTPTDKTLVDNAVLDMGTAYTDAAGRALPDATELHAGDLSGQTITPGLYKWAGSVIISADVTLSGGANDVWIFQIGGNLDVASGADITSGVKVLLSGGAQAANVFWQVGGLTGATLGTYSTFNGNILSAKQIVIQTGAVLTGRAFADTQVTLDANTVSVPVLVVPPATGPVFIDLDADLVHDVGVEQFFSTVQAAVSAAISGDTIVVTAGTYDEVGQILINKNLSIVGVGDPVIRPFADLPQNNNVAGAWFLVDPDIAFNLSNVTLDGNGMKVHQGIRSHGITTIDGVNFLNIRNSANPYVGFAVANFGGVIPGGAGSDSHSLGGATSTLTVTNSTFAAIGRIGILVKGTGSIAVITSNTYAGKGDGDFLDYAFEVGAGGFGNITSNAISGNRGVAASDGSTSAGILVTDFFGTGTSATINGNAISSSTQAVAVGFSETDASVVVAHLNNFAGNAFGMSSTNPIVDATDNWWGTGDRTGIITLVSEGINFDPWCGNSACSTPIGSGPEVTETLTNQIVEVATTSAGVVQVEIASGTTVTGPNTWDGTMNTTPTSTTSFTLTADSGFIASAVSAIEVGAGDTPLTFSNAVRLLFAGQADNLVGYSRGGVFTPITDVCTDDTQATNDAALALGADCKIVSGADLVVWTKHFTAFVTYTQTPAPAAPAPSGGGGGGGGGGGSGGLALGVPTWLAPGVVAGAVVPSTVPVGQVLGVATFNFATDLRIGMRHEDVIELQNRLRNEGVYSGPTTGYFGPLTLAGMKAYQYKYGISQTGTLDSLTRTQLNGSQVAGASTVNVAAMRSQIAGLQAQLVALLQQFVQMLLAQLR